MADQEESSPFLKGECDSRKEIPVEELAAVKPVRQTEWTADGVPLGHGSVLGEPIARSQWETSLCDCFGRNDEFCSSDLEVCVLGSFVPCLLYGSNVERLGSGLGSFGNHCVPYTSLYLIGNSLFGGNILAPCFSYPSRTVIAESLTWREIVKPFRGHVDAAKEQWTMKVKERTVNRPVILPPIFSATLVLFARKPVNCAGVCLIQLSTIDLFWS